MTAADAKPKRRRGRQGKQDGAGRDVSNNSGAHADDDVKKGQHKSLLVSLVETTWYDYCHDTPGRNATTTTHPPLKGQPGNTAALVLMFKAKADAIMKDELELLTKTKDEKWVETTMKKGTLKDRIAAMSVLVSTNPLHKLYALEQLLDMAVHQSNSRVAQLAAEALEDLFLNNLLVPTRKLIPMNQRPLYRYDTNATTLSPRILLLWRFEDLIIDKYNSFLRGYLQATLKDGMELSKLFCLRCASRLLRGTPQGEAVLLQMLVNKLGDPAKKTAAAAGHELRRVLDEHSNMQLVVAREVQQLAHRPALSPKALYNCIIFLNQLQLSMQDKVLPTLLIATYFRLFDVATKEHDALKGRLLGALLTGVNRAHPFLQDNDAALKAHMDVLYRVVHTAPPSASTQALLLLFHVAVGSNNNNKTNNNNSNNNSNDSETTTATTKKLTAGKTSEAKDRFYRALYSKLNIISSGKHLTMFFNLLYKSLKYDSNTTRVLIILKKLLCTCMHTSPPILAASLFLVNEILKLHPTLVPCLTTVLHGPPVMLDSSKREPALMCLDTTGDDETTTTPTHTPPTMAGLWEDQLLQHHVHPSVSKFAKTLPNVTYQGDPLKDFTLGPFLDKFAYRNPKKDATTKAESSSSFMVSKKRQEPVPVNDPMFLKQNNVQDDDVFFHQFFQERARRDEMKGIVRHNTPVDEEERDQQMRRGEETALDVAEGPLADEVFDEGWETDPEEEEFVDRLAEKLMEEHAAEGQADFDDEDPDMEGWDDMKDDDVDEKNDLDDDESSDGVELIGDDVDDEDGNAGPIHISEMFTDSDEEDEEDEDSSDEEQARGSKPDDDDFMDAGDDSDEMPDFEDQEASDDEPSITGASSDDDVAFAEDSEDDERLPTMGKRKNRVNDVVFADASEYEEMIAKAYANPSLEDSVVVPLPDTRKKRSRRNNKNRV